MKTKSSLTQADGAASASALAALPGADYARDAVERSVLFLDALRQRGNIYQAHLKAGEPDLLKFEHELVLDGRQMARPCNYMLLHILPLPEVPLDPHARPVVVVDPRAGHGPGIGGFKRDSEVGMALLSGHPVYFVSFGPQPEEGQTLLDVAAAEALFLEAVAQRHPDQPGKPLVIGNCQAGWAMAGLAAMRPELFGPLILVGSPLSYWAGGAKMNPMRYSGATLGGAWLAALTADLGADRFDGAHLVENFEKLNPANTLWGRYYKLWSQVDSESERFLEFERWWGGYFRMSGHEIESIVENLFVGNRLARGDVQIGGQRLDLRNISAPVVVFASWGDNITPPPQALNWIIDAWGDERAIAAAGRVIVYVLHDSVGHLGIFVGAEVARKEHDQIVNSLDVIEHLPPGLYEMKLQTKDGHEPPSLEGLEPGSYSVHFEHRTMDDLRALNPEGRDEEQLFSTVAKVSEINTALYKTCVRPFVRPLANRAMADAMTDLHPLRQQREAMSDAHPAAAPLAAWAEQVRQNRQSLPEDHAARRMEGVASSWIESSLNLFRDLRDQATVQFARMAFGKLGIGAWLPPDRPDEQVAKERADVELDRVRQDVLAHIHEGGLAQAVCRIVLAGMACSGRFERRSLRLAQRLAELPSAEGHRPQPVVDWYQRTRDEARIGAVAPTEALDALARMLPDNTDRERALAIAAAVLLVEPGQSAPLDPAAVLIQQLIVQLDVEPGRVNDLAAQLTALATLGDATAAPMAPPAPTAAPAAPRRRAKVPKP